MYSNTTGQGSHVLLIESFCTIIVNQIIVTYFCWGTLTTKYNTLNTFYNNITTASIIMGTHLLVELVLVNSIRRWQ